MPSFTQRGLKKCPKCKTETENKKCPNCGSLTKGTGAWTVRFRFVDESLEEKNIRLSGFGTKAEANDAYLKYMSEHKQCTKRKTEVSTFGELCEKYLEDIKNRLKESSRYSTQKVIDLHIAPYFKDKKISSIKKLDILEWQNILTEKGLQYRYKKSIRTLLSSIWTFGYKYYDTSPNLVPLVTPFRKTEKKKEMQIWSEEEFSKFISVVEDPIYRMLFETYYLTGMRKGECLALTWKDVDLVKETIDINKTATRKNLSHAPYIITPPKNESSYRTISIAGLLIEKIKEFKKYSATQYDLNDSSYVFFNDRPIPENTLRMRFLGYIKESGVKQIRIHDLRHSHASLLIQKGASIVLVAKRLGHSDIEQTLNTYSHLIPNEENDLMKKITFNL